MKTTVYITEHIESGKREIVFATSELEARAIAGKSAHTLDDWKVVTDLRPSVYLERESYYQDLYLSADRQDLRGGKR
jgi:hypothetical protein